jgi:5-methyltetrahydrofolate--homocysteine methyltransferase
MARIAEDIRTDLDEALRAGDAERAEAVTRQALEEGADPLDVIQEIIVPTLTELGQEFQDYKIFLPGLMLASKAAKQSSALLEKAAAEIGRKATVLGTVVIGTIEHDVHDIGKNLVSTILNAHGFKMIDLGRDVAPSAFLEAATREGPDIVAMSSLMTTTRPGQRKTIDLFAEAGERKNFKMIVGGGSADQRWAEEIGADGYAPDPGAAAELCKKLVGAE